MTAFNVVRFRVKPEGDEDFLEANRRRKLEWSGMRRVTIIKIGERSYCLIGEWDSRECQELCVRDFCEGGFWFAYIGHKASEARLTILLGRSERSSPKAAQRRATDAGLDGEDASQAANGRGVRTRLCRGIFTAKPLNQCNDLRIAALFTSSAMDRRPGRSPHDGGRRITIALLINENCTACDACEPVCPNQAITAGNPIYVIDPDGQQGELNRAYIAFLH